MITDQIQEAAEKTKRQGRNARELLGIVNQALPIWWKAKILASPKSFEIDVTRRAWKYVMSFSMDLLLLSSGFSVIPQYNETLTSTLQGITLSPYDTAKEKERYSYFMAKIFAKRIEEFYHNRYDVTIENPER